MDEIFHQLGDLFVASVPTVILFLLVWFFYKVLVYVPLTRVLAERRARTSGAVEDANAAIQAADAKTQEYEAKLRAARMELTRQREERLHHLSREKEGALADARHAAEERVKTLRSALEKEASDARASLENSADQLAVQILRAVLPGTSAEGAR